MLFQNELKKSKGKKVVKAENIKYLRLWRGHKSKTSSLTKTKKISTNLIFHNFSWVLAPPKGMSQIVVKH